MSLPSTTLLAPNFTARELGADIAGIPAEAQSNLYKVAAWLQAFRAKVGNRAVRVNTSGATRHGYRSPAMNTAVGGASTSDHLEGLAADFDVPGLGWYDLYKVVKAGGLPPFDQIIFYPLDGHVHLGLGARMRGEIRVHLAEPGYPLLTPELAAKLRGGTSVALIVFAVLLLLYAARKGFTV